MNLLYQASYFKTYQCDAKRCFYLVAGDTHIQLSCCQLLALRNKVNNLDLESHFNGENAHGIEIISLCNREHLLVLNTHQIIELKELVKVTFGIFELNGLV